MRGRGEMQHGQHTILVHVFWAAFVAAFVGPTPDRIVDIVIRPYSHPTLRHNNTLLHPKDCDCTAIKHEPRYGVLDVLVISGNFRVVRLWPKLHGSKSGSHDGTLKLTKSKLLGLHGITRHLTRHTLIKRDILNI